MVKIICSDLVKRQVKGSAFSHSIKHTFEEIADLTTKSFLEGNFRKGFRDGVFLVSIDPDGFVSGIANIKDSKNILVKHGYRNPNEESYIQICSDGSRLSAKRVDVVIYSRDALLEGKENTDLSADYEIVSINVSPEKEVPMDPYTMTRNQLCLTGGTKTEYPSEKWAEAVYFWNNHTKVMPSKTKFNMYLNKAMYLIGVISTISILTYFAYNLSGDGIKYLISNNIFIVP